LEASVDLFKILVQRHMATPFNPVNSFAKFSDGGEVLGPKVIDGGE